MGGKVEEDEGSDELKSVSGVRWVINPGVGKDSGDGEIESVGSEHTIYSI